MKQLEDIIKDRLEGYESSLPEGDRAEFNALLDASAKAEKKRGPAYLAWLAPLAAAAGLALFFVFEHSSQQESIQVVDGSSLVADVAKAESLEDVIMDLSMPSGLNEKPEGCDSAAIVSKRNEANNVESSQQAGVTEQNGEQKRNDDDPSMGSSTGYSPFVPSAINSRKPVSVKVGAATAGVIGGAAIAALAETLPKLLVKNDSEAFNPGGTMTDPEPPVDSRAWNDTHKMPLRAGLSLRIPFSDRWSLTTGLEYSLYSSQLEYSLSGIHKQSAHYLGIPLRADFTIAKNTWMDVYVGAGAAMDFCMAAYDSGQKINKDGVGFAMIGAGGIQFNISKNLGLFLEPSLSWDMTSGNRVLETFRSERPVMLTVSTGLRFTLPSR